MKRMETVPRELNLVKKVADFKLMRGNTMSTRKRGTCKKIITNEQYDDDHDHDHDGDDDDYERHRCELAPDEVERGGAGSIGGGGSTEIICCCCCCFCYSIATI